MAPSSSMLSNEQTAVVPRHAHTYQPSDPIQSNKSGISIIRVSVLCPDRRHTKYICIYINLRRSRDDAFVRSCVWSTGVCLLSLLHSVRFGHQLRCAHKRIANIRKVYMERKNMQLELIRFRKKYRIYSRLLFRTDEVNATRVFTLG